MPVLLDRDPPEVVVHDEESACAYIAGETARLPLRLPIAHLEGPSFDRRLEGGDRRHGSLLYRPSCPRCRRCEAIRVDVQAFRLGRTHRRVLRRGDASLTIERGVPEVSPERLALYEKHKRERNLHAVGEPPIDAISYQRFLVDSCTRSFELRYLHDGRLVGVAIADRGADALSAVYCYYDPELSDLSIGTYSILKQIELCRAGGLRHLYLGLYIADSPVMSYKARFLPHERLVGGAWQRFERTD